MHPSKSHNSRKKRSHSGTTLMSKIPKNMIRMRNVYRDSEAGSGFLLFGLCRDKQPSCPSFSPSHLINKMKPKKARAFFNQNGHSHKKTDRGPSQNIFSHFSLSLGKLHILRNVGKYVIMSPLGTPLAWLN